MKKQQIITFFMGILIGAIITAAIFLIFKPGNSRKIPEFSESNKNGEKFNHGNGEFDPSNFKPGEGKRKSKDNNEEKGNDKEDDKNNKDLNNEKQD